MSRHRIVRSMNYSDECDGFDDIYGHSVEEDYSMSPSDAAFMYDRNSRQPAEFSAFLPSSDNIAEEDESDLSIVEGNERTRSDSQSHIRPKLSDIDEAKLRSCLEEIRNVIGGDIVPENILVETVLRLNFDVTQALDEILRSPQKQNKNDWRDLSMEKFIIVSFHEYSRVYYFQYFRIFKGTENDGLFHQKISPILEECSPKPQKKKNLHQDKDDTSFSSIQFNSKEKCSPKTDVHAERIPNHLNSNSIVNKIGKNAVKSQGGLNLRELMDKRIEEKKQDAINDFQESLDSWFPSDVSDEIKVKKEEGSASLLSVFQDRLMQDSSDDDDDSKGSLAFLSNEFLKTKVSNTSVSNVAPNLIKSTPEDCRTASSVVSLSDLLSRRISSSLTSTMSGTSMPSTERTDSVDSLGVSEVDCIDGVVGYETERSASLSGLAERHRGSPSRSSVSLMELAANHLRRRTVSLCEDQLKSDTKVDASALPMKMEGLNLSSCFLPHRGCSSTSKIDFRTTHEKDITDSKTFSLDLTSALQHDKLKTVVKKEPDSPKVEKTQCLKNQLQDDGQFKSEGQLQNDVQLQNLVERTFNENCSEREKVLNVKSEHSSPSSSLLGKIICKRLVINSPRITVRAEKFEITPFKFDKYSPDDVVLMSLGKKVKS